jgi:hypothetical protein
MSIFESPDHGGTIYERDFGGTKRKKIKTSVESERLNRWLVWQQILIASETNLELKEALDKAQIIYELHRT